MIDLILPYTDMCIALHTQYSTVYFTGDSGGIQTHDLCLPVQKS